VAEDREEGLRPDQAAGTPRRTGGRSAAVLSRGRTL
jgi:hypothetical protein